MSGFWNRPNTSQPTTATEAADTPRKDRRSRSGTAAASSGTSNNNSTTPPAASTWTTELCAISR